MGRPRIEARVQPPYSEDATVPPSAGLLPWTLHPWLATVERRMSATAARARTTRPMRLLVKTGVKTGTGIRILDVLSRKMFPALSRKKRSLVPDSRMQGVFAAAGVANGRKQYIATPLFGLVFR